MYEMYSVFCRAVVNRSPRGDSRLRETCGRCVVSHYACPQAHTSDLLQSWLLMTVTGVIEE